MASTSIFIVGPSSTGKTTLCRALAERLGLDREAVVGEVARDVMRSQGYTRKDIGKLEMQRAIMEAHLMREEEGVALNPPVQICDRSGVDPIVYAMLTARDAGEAREKRETLLGNLLFQRALVRYRRATFILLGPVEEWLVDDGIRSIENQLECFTLFEETLRKLDIPFHEVGRELMLLENRVDRVIDIAGI